MKPERKTNIVLCCAVALAWSGLYLAPVLSTIGITSLFTVLLMERLLKSTPKGSLNMAIILTTEQKITLAVAPKTASGNVATLDGPPTWTVSDEAVAELVVAEDGLSATVVAKTAGAVQVTVTADADLDANETREIAGVLDILIVPAEAVTLGISAGIPEQK